MIVHFCDTCGARLESGGYRIDGKLGAAVFIAATDLVPNHAVEIKVVGEYCSTACFGTAFYEHLIKDLNNAH